jgi:hypothetical protein
MPPPAAPSKLTGGKMAAIVLVIVGAFALPVIGVVSALAIFGVRKYLVHAKAEQASHEVTRLASGIVRCATEAHPGSDPGLPDSSPAVPPALSAMSDKPYQSTPPEWTGAFACAGFSQTRAQVYQYQWLKRSATSGVATAVTDLDDDGIPDITIEQSVTCPAGEPCTLGPLIHTGF